MEPSMSEKTFDLRPYQESVKPGERASGSASGRSDKRNAKAKGRSTPRRVLLVDDSDDACLAQSMLLKMRGYEVQTATSGPAALAAYEQFKPNIVLLDLGMPEMSGYEVVRQLRGKPGGENSLFIAVSGRAEEEDRIKAREAGFHRYALKPVDLTDLEELFEGASAMPRASENN
jgi:two-component system, OmpR family, response regulator